MIATAVSGVRSIILFQIALAAIPARADAAPNRPGKGGDIGLGVMLGDPTGVSFKWVPHAHHSLDAALGFGPFHLGGGRLHATWQWQSRPLGQPEDLAIVAGVGLGLGMAFWHKRYIGPGTPDRFAGVAMFVRAPAASIAFNLMKLPVDVFLEAAYSPLVAPPLTFWNFDFALGARGWF